MDEFAQANRMSEEPEDLNRAEQRQRGRRLAYEAYVADKRLRGRAGGQAAETRQRDERTAAELRARRARWRDEVAASFGGAARLPEPATSGPEAAEGDRAEAKAPSRRKLFGEVPSIEGERVVLDPVVDADAGALLDLIENPFAQRYLPAYLFEKQFDDVRDAIAQLYGDLFANEESLILAVRDKETGELAGLAEFYGLRDELHKVSMGCRLRESFWGRGLATEAARLMVGYLYRETDIEIITASTMVENKASARVLEKAGFIRTARSVEEDWGFAEPVLVDKWFC